MTVILDRVVNWLVSRSPRRQRFLLTRKNIYIFPSVQGMCFMLLLLLMLLTAINYQNSLIYLLTFFLGTLFFLSIWQCFLNFAGLNIEKSESGRVFEGEPAEFFCHLSKPKGLPLALKIGSDKQQTTKLPIILNESIQARVQMPPLQRGVHKLPKLYLESRFPFGLVLAWSWLKLDAQVLVYPRPEQGLPDRLASDAGDQPERTSSIGDLNDLKEYQSGDPSNRILWKKFAAKDQLIIRHHEQTHFQPDWVSWDNYQVGSTEQKLRYLCFDICQLSAAHKAYGLSIPGIKITPDYGEIHRRKCLDALALFQQHA